MRPFTYVRAQSPAEAVSSFVSAGEGARYLAGGTTLYDLMKLDVERPGTVIDIRALAGLTAIEVDGAGGLRIGAMASMTDVATHSEVSRRYPVLAESLELAASRQLRNMASVGGNLLQRTRCAYFRGHAGYACNKRNPGSGCSALEGIDRGHAVLGGSDACIAVYPGDWAIALTALDAIVEVLGPQGNRTVSIHDLYRDPGTTPQFEHTLTPGELVTHILIPPLDFGASSTYLKIRDRESYAFALASAAVAVDLDGESIRDVRIAVGGLATRPWRGHAAEQTLIGQRMTPTTVQKAAAAIFTDARSGRHNAFRIDLGIRTVVAAIAIARQRSNR